MSWEDYEPVTIRKWLARFTAETGEQVTTMRVVVDAPDDIPTYRWEDECTASTLPIAEVPDEILDAEFDDGFGGTNCRPFWAWSPSWVLLVRNYDGSEGLRWVPRHPDVPSEPTHIGGG